MQDAILAIIGPPIVTLLTLAVWIRKPRWTIRLVQSIVFLVAYTQLIIQFPRTHGWWFTFDIFYIITSGAMAMALGHKKPIAWAYALIVGLAVVEYSYATPETKDIANRIYYVRLWGMSAIDTAFALLLYLGIIGNPDKEQERARASEETPA